MNYKISKNYYTRENQAEYKYSRNYCIIFIDDPHLRRKESALMTK